MDLRRCRTCLTERNLHDFGVNNTFVDGRTLRKHTCKACMATRARTLYQLHKAHKPPVDACCPICMRPTRRWVLDHDHATGTFRGWLCNDCNSSMGKFNDDVAILRRAILYLTNQLPTVGGDVGESLGDGRELVEFGDQASIVDENGDVAHEE